MATTFKKLADYGRASSATGSASRSGSSSGPCDWN